MCLQYLWFVVTFQFVFFYEILQQQSRSSDDLICILQWHTRNLHTGPLVTMVSSKAMFQLNIFPVPRSANVKLKQHMKPHDMIPFWRTETLEILVNLPKFHLSKFNPRNDLIFRGTISPRSEQTFNRAWNRWPRLTWTHWLKMTGSFMHQQW